MFDTSSTLYSISPIDGRYRSKTDELSKFFSEFALIKYRIKIEIEYFIALCMLPLPELKSFEHKHFTQLTKIYTDFSKEDAIHIKEIEKTTNHDVKAVEYFIKEKFDMLNLSSYKEFIHFGLTSQDINNTAIPLSLKDAIHFSYNAYFDKLINVLSSLEQEWKEIPLLAKTHGQPASPTLLGKEIGVFKTRLEHQKTMLDNIPFAAKFGGATGNMNAHYVTYPQTDWHTFSQEFVKKLGLQRSYPTTQIEHYDYLAALLDNLKRINTILIDFSRDCWQYISMNYFKQKINPNEVGSSAMPHKVNPIDFENAEGNLGLANAIFEHLSAKLPISRLQRDLTDSTVLRNLGVPIAHTLLSFQSILKGINKIEVNKKIIDQDLEHNWIVVAEAIQNILRRINYPQPYEALKNLTRGKEHISKQQMLDFIDKLNIDTQIKTTLKEITPFNYVGKTK